MLIKNSLIEKSPREYHNELNIEGQGRVIRSTTMYKMGGSRHELNADLQANGLIEPVSLKGHFSPSLQNMQVHINMTITIRTLECTKIIHLPICTPIRLYLS